MRALIGCMFGFSILVSTAVAQPVCLKGQSLADQAFEADELVKAAGPDVLLGSVSSPLSVRARALIYLTYASAADNDALDDLNIYVTAAMPCHPDDCDEGIALSRDEVGQLRALAMSDFQAYEDGTETKSWAPVLKTLATSERIQWAELALDCRFDGAGSIEAKPDPVTLSETNELITTKYSGPSSSSRFDPNALDQSAAPTEHVEKVYGSWAYGRGAYCDTNTLQTDLYAKANARAECKERGGSDGGTYIHASGFSGAYGQNTKQCYEAQAYTDCIFRN